MNYNIGRLSWWNLPHQQWRLKRTPDLCTKLWTEINARNVWLISQSHSRALNDRSKWRSLPKSSRYDSLRHVWDVQLSMSDCQTMFCPKRPSESRVRLIVGSNDPESASEPSSIRGLQTHVSLVRFVTVLFIAVFAMTLMYLLYGLIVIIFRLSNRLENHSNKSGFEDLSNRTMRMLVTVNNASVPEMDAFSFLKTDAYVKLYVSDATGLRFIGQSQEVDDTLSPHWDHVFEVDVLISSTFDFELWDRDLLDDDKIGNVSVSVEKLLRQSNRKMLQKELAKGCALWLTINW